MKVVLEARISAVIDLSEEEIENLTEDEALDLLLQELSYGNVDIDDIEWY
jgi:ribosome assembly protein YihI (activator of Der GTPase)